jgi:hypothetical protein
LAVNFDWALMLFYHNMHFFITIFTKRKVEHTADCGFAEISVCKCPVFDISSR